MACYLYLEGLEYFKVPSVRWALQIENENGVKKAKNRGQMEVGTGKSEKIALEV
jgi:hypothetical protein